MEDKNLLVGDHETKEGSVRVGERGEERGKLVRYPFFVVSLATRFPNQPFVRNASVLKDVSKTYIRVSHMNKEEWKR